MHQSHSHLYIRDLKSVSYNLSYAIMNDDLQMLCGHYRTSWENMTCALIWLDMKSA